MRGWVFRHETSCALWCLYPGVSTLGLQGGSDLRLRELRWGRDGESHYEEGATVGRGSEGSPPPPARPSLPHTFSYVGPFWAVSRVKRGVRVGDPNRRS